MSDEKTPMNVDGPGRREDLAAVSVGASPSAALVAGQHPGITCVPGVCGGNPCIKGTRLAVWILYRAKLAGASDNQLLRQYPFLKKSDLKNAWRFAKEHTAEIEQTIRENDVW